MSQLIQDRPFGVLDSVIFSNSQMEALLKIEEYDFWFIAERLEKKSILPTHLIQEAIVEFKRYLALIVLGHKDIGMISPEVDEVWHTFILFTYRYNEFCLDVFNEFLHHYPTTSRGASSQGGGGMRLVNAYIETFGDIPVIWHSEKMIGITSNLVSNPSSGGSKMSGPSSANCTPEQPACGSSESQDSTN